MEYLVALNNSKTPQTVTVPTFYSEGTAFELLLAEDGEGEQRLATGADGQVRLAVPALGFTVYKAANAISASGEAPGINMTKPQAGETVTLRLDNRDGIPYREPLEVRAELDRDIPVEVTFAVKAGDGPYRIVGTDNNPPYRVFYRLPDSPEDTRFTFKAVVNDLSGHLNAAMVENVGVTFEEPVVELLHAKVVIHYSRSDGDYGDPESGDFNDYWGLHLWGEAIAPGVEPPWAAPRRFDEKDACGVYTVIALKDDTKPVNFIVHRGDTKDGTDQDRSFHPRDDAPEVWLKQGDPKVYTEPPAGCPRAG
jgi:hypothetical protein